MNHGVIVLRIGGGFSVLLIQAILKHRFGLAASLFFVPDGCLQLNYSSLLKEGHMPTPALQPFFLLTAVLHLFPIIFHRISNDLNHVPEYLGNASSKNKDFVLYFK